MYGTVRNGEGTYLKLHYSNLRMWWKEVKNWSGNRRNKNYVTFGKLFP